MLQKLKTTLRQFFAAILLLSIAVLGLELFLQTKIARSGSIVAQTASPDAQSLLIPSSTTHHEMVRLKPESGSDFPTNSYGLRGPEPDETAANLRVLVLGDETVLGLQLLDDQTLPARLQLRRIEHR